jgi:ADP-L-glycero-D-manno-heptose 6-epimerase
MLLIYLKVAPEQSPAVNFIKRNNLQNLMRILVTGGTGFIGSNLTTELQKQGHDVLITGNATEQPIAEFKGKILEPSLIGIDWDEVGRVDVLCHQAANNVTTFLDEKEIMLANVRAAKTLFEYVISKGCRRIVFASSTAVYGDAPAPYKEDTKLNPLNPYAVSKIELERYAMQLASDNPKVRIVGLRYCNVYGPRENHKGKRASMIYQLAQQMKNKNPVLFKFGEQKRDYIYVKDVVRANILASQAKESCIINCGYGAATTFNEIVDILNKVLGTDRKIEYIDNPYEDRYQNHTECNMLLAEKMIGFVPEYDIRKGIEDYYKNGYLTR